MLQEILTLNIWGFFLVFARVGLAVSLLPGFGASYITARTRLALALMLSLVLMPLLVDQLPVMPSSASAMGLMLLGESMVGGFMGAVVRVLISALQSAGSLIALFSSMANAMIQDPIAEQQSTVVAGFLSTLGMVLIFVVDAHHLMIGALVESYGVFEAAAIPPFGDMAQYFARRVADAFKLGLQLATPFALVGLSYYIALGIMGRLMPQLPVFFFGLPIQITLQFLVFMIALSGIMTTFLIYFGQGLNQFILG